MIKRQLYLQFLLPTLREKCANTEKYGPEKTPYLDTFHAALFWFNQFRIKSAIITEMRRRMNEHRKHLK